MRTFVLAVCLSVCVSCQLVEPQFVPLSTENVAALEMSLGALDVANAESVKLEASRVLGMQVEEVVKIKTASGEAWLAKLSPPAQEIATAAGTTFLDGILANPTAAGASAAGLAAIGAGLAVWRRRQAAGKVVVK